MLGVLILIGVLVWVLNYLLGEYIQPAILALINKLAIVLCVIVVLLWLLGVLGIYDFDMGGAFWGKRHNGP